MSRALAAIEDAIERGIASAKRLEQAAKHSISKSQKQRAQQQTSAAEAQARVDALVEAAAALDALYQEALKACRFLDGIGRNDRAQPLRDAAHRIRSADDTLEIPAFLRRGDA